ncbi:MAG: zinc ABC transporter substrate-binding protein [Bacteroidetes bacterium]|nr:zinc ABC transporter substrate-binding protein [Bacteroidota bacterium]
MMRLFLWYIIGFFFLTSCTSPDRLDTPIQDRTIRIVATTSIVADLARQIGGAEVTVESLMGPGVDPHLYIASAGDVSKMSHADIIVYNGLHLEGKMGDLFQAMNERGYHTMAVAEVNSHDSLLISSELFQGNYDPHIWFDANLWAQAGFTLANALSLIDSTRADVFVDQASNFQSKLMDTEEYVFGRVYEIPPQKRVLVTSHDAFGYFGRAYGFEVRGLQGISTALEVGAKDVQDLATMVAERRIPAMFVESSISPRGIEAVQEAVRSKGFNVRIGGTLYGDALGGASTRAVDYSGMIRHNIDTIVDALTDSVFVDH